MSTGAPHDPLIGFVLEGRYRLIGVLGRGGMGNVYVAEETRLGRRYALKVLKPELARERVYVERFLREAQTIARLQHPNIVDIHSYGEDPSGLVFFTMELLSGEDLESRVSARASRPYTVQDACRWALEIARAVAVVHEHGLIHRDLKTQNVFLARRREGGEVIKLLDFGIARAEEGSELTKTGATLGTPSYMSPEQLGNHSVDRRSDIYSFGVLLFKLLTGELPFRGSAIQVVTQHLNTPPPPPSSVAPDAEIPPELDELVLKTLAKHAADRPASMAEVERALLAALERSTALPASRPPSRPTPSDTEVRAALAVTLPARPEVAPSAPSPPASDDKDDDVTAKIAASSGSTAPALVVKPEGQDGALERPRGRPRYRAAFTLTLACVAGVVIWLAAQRDGGAPATDPAATAASTQREPSHETKQTVETNREPSAPEVAPKLETTVQPPQSPESPATVLPSEEPPPAETAEPTPAADAVEPAMASQTTKTRPAKQPKKRDTSAPLPPKSKPESPVASDPLAKLKAGARKCRVDFDAIGGPPIVIRYMVISDGSVGSATSESDTPLGKCLVGAVRAAKFSPGIRVETISL